MADLNMKHRATSAALCDIYNGAVSTYSFKKRKPLPGAYPRKFSPYVLINTPITRAVQLSRQEIRNDLNDIRGAIANEFSSHYFEEVGIAVTNEKNVEVTCQKPSVPLKIHRRAHRRPNFSSILAPMTEAEERRQLRAALKASQLEGELMMNGHEYSRMRRGSAKTDIVADQEYSDGAKALRRVFTGHVLRTG